MKIEWRDRGRSSYGYIGGVRLFRVFWRTCGGFTLYHVNGDFSSTFSYRKTAERHAQRIADAFARALKGESE